MTNAPRSSAEIERLLPFRVNGTLAGEEAHAVAGALAADPDLQLQERLLHVLRDEMRAAEAVPSPGAFGLARLNRALDAERKTRMPAWLPAAVAAAVAFVATLAGTLYFAAPRQAPEGVYVQASGQEAGDLIVAFVATATQDQIGALLLAQNLSIVDGPSALGLYRLRVAEGVAPAEALAVLQAATGIVSSVQAAE